MAKVGRPKGSPPTPSSFKPGQSGNPGGRDVVPREIKDLAKQHTPEAITKAVAWMRSDSAVASMAAIEFLMNRAWGRPVQTMNVRKINSIEDLTDEELQALTAADERDGERVH